MSNNMTSEANYADATLSVLRGLRGHLDESIRTIAGIRFGNQLENHLPPMPTPEVEAIKKMLVDRCILRHAKRVAECLDGDELAAFEAHMERENRNHVCAGCGT